MAHQFTTSYLKDSIDVFRYYKKLGERAVAQCPDDALFESLDAESNSIAIVVKHMAGNMRSRWTDFLTTDGEKPDRNRDTEFETPPKTRAALMELWERGWKYVFDALEPLGDEDLVRTITIRTEPHSVMQAIKGKSLTTPTTWGRSFTLRSILQGTSGRRLLSRRKSPQSSTREWLPEKHRSARHQSTLSSQVISSSL